MRGTSTILKEESEKEEVFNLYSSTLGLVLHRIACIYLSSNTVNLE